MLRAVLHPLSDQPLVVEVDVVPEPGDTSIVCHNVRTLDGKRPKYIDRKDSTFVFPLNSIRFVEVYSGEAGSPEEAPVEVEPDELEIDEEFLRRVREA
ncbi:MAG TPA: hypothetical protein VKR30_08590 [Candidatus Limnocylindrales bacterium]|nr:hypothetical protein [Candidatus Limnocylindrales bacterium]